MGLLSIIILGLAKPDTTIEKREQQLIEAASRNDLRAIPKLVQRKANINAQDAQGRTALLVAMGANQLMGRLLIDVGAM